MKRVQVALFRDELRAFLDVAERRYKCKFDIGTISIVEGVSASIPIKSRTVSEEGGLKYSETELANADYYASKNGVFHTGNFLGSIWEIMGTQYEVIGVSTRSPKYPVKLKRWDGKVSKCMWGFILKGRQVEGAFKKPEMPEEKKPEPELLRFSRDDFEKWVFLDPEDDRISRMDEDIVDAVNDYLSFDVSSNKDIVDLFFETFEKFEELGKTVMLKHLSDIYTSLFLHNNMADAIRTMQNVLGYSKK